MLLCSVVSEEKLIVWKNNGRRTDRQRVISNTYSVFVLQSLGRCLRNLERISYSWFPIEDNIFLQDPWRIQDRQNRSHSEPPMILTSCILDGRSDRNIPHNCPLPIGASWPWSKVISPKVTCATPEQNSTKLDRKQISTSSTKLCFLRQ